MKAASEKHFERLTDIIWLQTGFLGDIILNTGAFRVAAECLPHVRQHLITTKIGATALRDHALLHSIHVFQKAKVSNWRTIQSLAEDLQKVVSTRESAVLLQVHRSYRSGFLATILRYPRIVYAETDFAFAPLARVPRVGVLHEAQRDALLLEPLGVDRKAIMAAKLKLDPLPIEEVSYGAFFSQQRPVLLCAPGSVWGTKRWLPESYHALMQRVLAETSAAIVFLGGDAEREVTAQVTSGLPPGDRWLNLAGQTSLDDLRRIYPHATALVSNDSSAIHYASAFQIPTIAIFGATVSAMGFGPLADGSHVCELADLTCRPCSDHGPQTCPRIHFRCMRDLDVDTVWRKLSPLLRSEHPVPCIS